MSSTEPELLGERLVLRITSGLEVADQIEQLVLIERIDHACRHERHGVRLAALNLIERHRGELLRITGIGRHHQLAILYICD